MTDHVKKELEKAGFTPPVAKLVKPDPRGAEYGYYAIEETEDGFLVDRCNADREILWTCYFKDLENVLFWASDIY
jgi:hypothetical protein